MSAVFRPVERPPWLTGPFEDLSAKDLHSLPAGSKRLFLLREGLAVAVEKTKDGRWRVQTSNGFAAELFEGCPSAERVREGTSVPPEQPRPPAVSPSARQLAAMQRVAAAKR